MCEESWEPNYVVKQKLLEDIGLWFQLQVQYYWSRYDDNFTVTRIVNCHQRHQPNMLFKQMSRTDYWPNDLVWLTKVDPTLTQSSALPIKHHSFQEISSLSKTDPCVGKIFRDPPQWSYLAKVDSQHFLSRLTLKCTFAHCPPAVSKMKREIQEIFFTRMVDASLWYLQPG